MKKIIYSVEKVDLNINKKNPSQLVIQAEGTTRTTGWENFELILKSNADVENGIYEFDFVGNEPQFGGDSMDPNRLAEYIFEEIPENLIKVIVSGETNSQEKNL